MDLTAGPNLCSTALLTSLTRTALAPLSFVFTTGPCTSTQFQTPRINKAVLEQYVGHTVCVVGKVMSHDEGASESILETSVREINKPADILVATGETVTRSRYIDVGQARSSLIKDTQ